MVTKVTDLTGKRVNDGSPTVKQAAEKPWMKHLGKLKHLRKETKRIDKRIEDIFEQIDPELWKPPAERH